MQKLLILTSDETLLKWKSLPAKKKHILAALNKTKNADWSIEIRYRALTPQVVNGRISHDWYNTVSYPLFREGYQHVVMHFSMAQWKMWGIEGNYNGFNQIDKDFVGESYIRADETTVHKYGRARRPRDLFSQFVQTLLHEILHELKRGTNQPDITHDYHQQHKDISGAFADVDMATYLPLERKLKGQISLLERIKGLWEQVVEYDRVLASRQRLQPLVARQADKVVEAMAMLGHPVRIVEGYRTPERQDELYAQGRTTPGRVVTNAKGNESAHNFGVAVDFIFKNGGYNAPEELWQTLGSVMKSQGFTWGGDWKSFPDKPHGELLLGYSLRDFQAGKVDYSKYQ